MPDKYQNQTQDKRLDSIESHITIINGELGELKIAMTKMNGDICSRLIKIESKINWYMLLTPLLTGVIGFLAFKAF